MKVEIKMTEEEYLCLFWENDGKQLHEREFTLNGVKLLVTEWHKKSPSWVGHSEIILTLVKPIKYKSPQELSAEESVKKAEEALRAAKEVLNKVKEK